MVDQDFVSGTVISSAWLNGINDAVKDMYGTTEFNLYVSVTGDDANDGLTALTPFATIQKAFDTLIAMGNVGGTRIINIAAGTYNTVANTRGVLGPDQEDEDGDPDIDTYQREGVVSVNYITIKGPDVGYDPTTNPWPTPTAIFDGGGTSSNCLIFRGSLLKVLVKDLKFKNFNGGSTTCGMVMDSGTLRTENIHSEACGIAISCQKGNLEVRGGDLYGTAAKAGIGVRSLFRNYHAIGDQSAVGSYRGPRIRFMSQGVLAQEGATGHSDSVLYEDCSDGLRVTCNSRVNYSYSNFKRCSNAIRADQNAEVFGSNTAEFNIGTADANIDVMSIQSGASSIERDAYQHRGITFAFPDYGDMPRTITGTATNQTIVSRDLEAGFYAPHAQYSTRQPMYFRMVAAGTLSAGVGDKQFKLRLGGANASVTVDNAESGAWSADGIVMIHDYNQISAHITFNCHTTGGTPKRVYVATATGSDDLRTTLTTVAFQIQLANAADDVTVNHALIELWG